MLVILFLFGLVFGSFINALVWRLHEQTLRKDKDTSILKGRSICPNCRTQLKTIDLVPVVSWITLKGRCRYCQKKISKEYPIVELSTAILFSLSYVIWPTNVKGLQIVLLIIWCLILTGLIALFIYDYKYRLLPSRIIYPLIGLALLFNAVKLHYTNDIFTYLIDLLAAVLVGGGVFYLIYLISGGKWIGGGDVRLGWLLGLIAGTPAKGVLFIFLACLLGTAYSVPAIIQGKTKKNNLIAFGPFLIIAIFIVQFYGQDIINWYRNIALG
ncbi:MAG TPA: prepilin peptidase [Candidatus Sulfotelmatobacter sp.]|nr:prepilin peptidase [Candidatus Sulfotelmatobacter sp.]